MKMDANDILREGGEDVLRATFDATAAQQSAALCGDTLLADLYAFLGRFVAYPSDNEHVAHVLWIMHTHLMDAWESTPRIAFLSPEPGSGKTRALELSELLVPNPVEAVNVTPAYLFRKVGSKRGPPTVLYDEIDTVSDRKRKTMKRFVACLMRDTAEALLLAV